MVVFFCVFGGLKLIFFVCGVCLVYCEDIVVGCLCLERRERLMNIFLIIVIVVVVIFVIIGGLV